MTDPSTSSLTRMLGVLDLFTENQLTWTAEAITEALQVSLPTGYRYLKVLVDAGLLQRNADSHYTLGPRIIVMDHFIRKSDPVLQCAVPFMQELVEATGFDCVISSLHGEQLLDTHREMGKAPAALSYGRGRPRPLFQGGAPKVILAQFPPARLHRLFDEHPAAIKHAGLPTEWEPFRRYYSAIRKSGFYVSNGELEPTLSAVAAPLVASDGRVLGALSVVGTVQRMAVINTTKLAQLVVRTAQEISARLP